MCTVHTTRPSAVLNHGYVTSTSIIKRTVDPLNCYTYTFTKIRVCIHTYSHQTPHTQNHLHTITLIEDINAVWIVNPFEAH